MSHTEEFGTRAACERARALVDEYERQAALLPQTTEPRARALTRVILEELRTRVDRELMNAARAALEPTGSVVSRAADRPSNFHGGHIGELASVGTQP